MDTFTFLALLLLPFVLLLFLQRKWRGSRILATLPNPTGVPILGNVVQLARVGGNPHMLFSQWAEKLGPIYKLKLASKWAVVVNDFQSINEVLLRKGRDFSGRMDSYRLQHLDDAMGIIVSDATEEWKLARKVVHSSLKAFGPGMGRIEDLALQMSEDFLKVFETSNGKAINPMPQLYEAALGMVSLLTYGEVFDQKSQSYIDSRVYTNAVGKSMSPGGSGPALDLYPWLRFFGNEAYVNLNEAKRRGDNLWKRVVKDQAEEESWLSMFDQQVPPVIHSLYKNNTEKLLSERYIQTTCHQLLIAGVITTSSTMYCFLLILLHHREVQARIQAEIKRVLGSKCIGLDHRADLPYTKAAILELHRYVTIIPTGFPHKAVKDTEILGHQIPAGTSVFLNIWAMHHDQEFWKDPWNFQPERFLDDDGQLLPVDHPNRTHLKPFGAGPRSCAGENIAQARIFLWTVAILQVFDLEPEGDKPLVSCDPRDYINDFTITPPPYKLRFVPIDEAKKETKRSSGFIC